LAYKNAVATLTQERIVTAAVVIIGNEILSGRTQETNLREIALTVGTWGIRVTEARVIPDVEDTIVSVVNEVRARHSYVFTTGGIGPTHDDITADCIAKAFGVPLIEHPAIAALIRKREAPPEIMASRLRMARVPEGAGLIANGTGGPPGFSIGNVYVMAGIPVVMQAMLSTLAGKLSGGAIVQTRSVSVFLPESVIAKPLTDLQTAWPEIEMGSYPFQRVDRYGTSLVLRGTNASSLDAALAQVRDMIVAAGGTPEDV
jgi:molybdopterin-biosynthesis enzyme MoeA-like protein